VRPEAACSACVHAHLAKCEPCSPRRGAAAPAHAHMPPWRQYALLACAHAHRATRQLCAQRAGISWRGCSTQRLWRMHTRCHGDSTQPLACVRACAPAARQPYSSHTRTTQPFFFLQVEVEPPFSPPASLVLVSFHCDANLYQSDLQSFSKTTFACDPRWARPALPATPGRGQSQGYGQSRGIVCVRLRTVKMRDLLMTILSFHSGASICICLGIPRCGVGLVLVSVS